MQGVSVVIPAFNAQGTIFAAVESILNQSLPPAEVIVVNDGSTDGTRSVLDGFGSSITVLDQSNAGLAAARNAGCSAARAELIAFMDADDLSRPYRLSIQTRMLEQNSDSVLCHAEFSSFGEGKPNERFHGTYYRAMGRHAALAADTFQNIRKQVCHFQDNGIDHAYTAMVGEIRPLLAHGNVVHPPTMMFRRSLWALVGPFDKTLRNMCDWEWIFRASQMGPFCFIDASVLDYRLSPGQLSGAAHRTEALLDVIEVATRIVRAAPGLYAREKAVFDADFAEFQIDLARSLAGKDRKSAISALLQSFRYKFLPSSVASVAAQIALPTGLVQWIKALKGRGGDQSDGT